MGLPFEGWRPATHDNIVIIPDEYITATWRLASGNWRSRRRIKRRPTPTPSLPLYRRITYLLFIHLYAA